MSQVPPHDSGGGFGLTIHVHLALPSFLEVGGVSLQGDVTLRATNDDGLADELIGGEMNPVMARCHHQALKARRNRRRLDAAAPKRGCLHDVF